MASIVDTAKLACVVQRNRDAGAEGASVLVLQIGGRWTLTGSRPSADGFLNRPEYAGCERLRFEFEDLESWDSSLLMFLSGCLQWADARDLATDLNELPGGVRRLMELSEAVPKVEGNELFAPPGWLASLGIGATGILQGVERYFEFVGQLLLDGVDLLRGRAKVRRVDLLEIVQRTGPMALPIVALLSFLTGLIIAFIGVIQLQKFAADIYVADLVGLATTRELGAVMAGVIMAGRTGAAFAAQIGSMRVNDEVDALTTFGISPTQFLVLPRVLALVLMMPLLCAFANLVSILGGMVVAISISDVSAVQYFNQINAAVGLGDLMVGIFKSAVFGVIIAVAGCYRGLNCGKDATAVGLAATSAVVTSITWIVVADAVFAVLFHLIGI